MYDNYDYFFINACIHNAKKSHYNFIAISKFGQSDPVTVAISFAIIY